MRRSDPTLTLSRLFACAKCRLRISPRAANLCLRKVSIEPNRLARNVLLLSSRRAGHRRRASEETRARSGLKDCEPYIRRVPPERTNDPWLPNPWPAPKPVAVERRWGSKSSSVSCLIRHTDPWLIFARLVVEKSRVARPMSIRARAATASSLWRTTALRRKGRCLLAPCACVVCDRNRRERALVRGLARIRRCIAPALLLCWGSCCALLPQPNRGIRPRGRFGYAVHAAITTHPSPKAGTSVA